MDLRMFKTITGNKQENVLNPNKLQHTERTFHQFNNRTFEGTVRNRDSGYFMLGMDRHNLEYLDGVVPNISQAVDIGTWCETELFCGAPFFHPRMIFQT